MLCRAALSQPPAEQLALQTELKRLEVAQRRAEEEHESQRQVLHTQLQREVSERPTPHSPRARPTPDVTS